MTYAIAVWDHELNDWDVKGRGLALFALRDLYREFLGMGYDRDLSILVWKEG